MLRGFVHGILGISSNKGVSVDCFLTGYLEFHPSSAGWNPQILITLDSGIHRSDENGVFEVPKKTSRALVVFGGVRNRYWFVPLRE